MRNLKKILALALALVMSMSLMAVANASDFSDDADIEYQEAVEVMTALEVIDGVGNNTFNPKGNVTRAQMAKMITIVSLGNVDAAAFTGTVTDLKDIDGHWAEAFIKYCYSQGIIAGKGGGVFAPNANVTAAEAAKMLLVAIGYNSDVQGYEGAQWAINVTRDAQLSNFYDGLSVTSNQALTREQAAQMIYNAIDTGVVEATPNWNASTGTVTYTYEKQPDTDDLLKETFNVTSDKDVLVKTVYDSEKDEYTYTLKPISTKAPADMMADYRTTLPGAKQAVSYDDVAPNHWANDAIRYVADKGYFAGTSETTFAPATTSTRAMLMTVLASMNGVDTTGGSTWYAKGMEWAKANGVSDGTNPNGAITREQLALMLYRDAGSPEVDDLKLIFSDANKVSSWASDAVTWAVVNGILSGKGNNTLDPQGSASRAEVAQMLYTYSFIR